MRLSNESLKKSTRVTINWLDEIKKFEQQYRDRYYNTKRRFETHHSHFRLSTSQPISSSFTDKRPITSRLTWPIGSINGDRYTIHLIPVMTSAQVVVSPKTLSGLHSSRRSQTMYLYKFQCFRGCYFEKSTKGEQSLEPYVRKITKIKLLCNRRYNIIRGNTVFYGEKE